MLYADTSALAKLVVAEAESDALRAYLREGEPLISSALAGTELIRAVRRRSPNLESQARGLLRTLVLVDVDEGILSAAATLEPPDVRTLDAIHLTTALQLGDELRAVLTYDGRMAEAGRAAGLQVAAPA